MKQQILLLIAIIVSLTSYGQDAELIAKAEAGDAQSQYWLACDYQYGWNGFPKDDSKYVYWLTKAAEGGHPDSQIFLANIFLNGDYGKYEMFINKKKAIYWLEEKLLVNPRLYEELEKLPITLPLLYSHLGTAYEDIKDYKNSVKWYKKGAYGGLWNCCYSLGLYYSDKKRKDYNKKEAIYWLKKAADIKYRENGEEDEFSAEALHKLGVYYNPGEKNSYASSSSNDASSSHSSSSSRGNGSSAAVAPLMTPVQVWNPCFMCGGTGLCTSCQGKGKDWYGNSYQLCVTCHGNMYCQKCGGRKGYYTTEYR